jgi:hypothetical protein
VPRIIVPIVLLRRALVQRDAEVGRIGVALLVQQDVAGLDVAMHDALSVSRRQGRLRLIDDPGGARRVELVPPR